jgi:hypothetical protein
MKPLMTFALGALAMYLLDRLTRAKVRERAGAAARTQLQPDEPSATPEGAHHLGR